MYTWGSSTLTQSQRVLDQSCLLGCVIFFIKYWVFFCRKYWRVPILCFFIGIASGDFSEFGRHIEVPNLGEYNWFCKAILYKGFIQLMFLKLTIRVWLLQSAPNSTTTHIILESCIHVSFFFYKQINYTFYWYKGRTPQCDITVTTFMVIPCLKSSCMNHQTI